MGLPAMAGLLLTSVGCASAPTMTPASTAQLTSSTLHAPHERTLPRAIQPQGDGPTYHRVRRGETLWRLSNAFGVDAKQLAAANRLQHPSDLRAGQLLVIPLPQESDRFLWPARGRVNRHRKSSATVSGAGLEIAALEGTFVRASRSGRVAVAASQLPTLGHTLILDHGDGYTTVYCGMDELLVQPGFQVRQGAPVGRLGRAPLYFEVRYQTRPRDPLAVLP
jgi:murein DD-endopeptidase MepM/ murein hydrolase activator NlpD